MKIPLDRLGSVGSLIAAAACPVCFPKLALIGAFFGLGGLAVYEAQLFVAAQMLVLVALVGHAIAYVRHRRRIILAAAIVGTAAIFIGLYAIPSEMVVYAGFAAMAGASLADIRVRYELRRK